MSPGPAASRTPGILLSRGPGGVVCFHATRRRHLVPVGYFGGGLKQAVWKKPEAQGEMRKRGGRLEGTSTKLRPDRGTRTGQSPRGEKSWNLGLI